MAVNVGYFADSPEHDDVLCKCCAGLNEWLRTNVYFNQDKYKS